MRARLVGQHERVLRLLVLKEVEDPVFFHEARHKDEVALVVLHAVVERGVRRIRLQLVVGEAGVLEHLLDDVGDRLALEDADVDAVPEKREGRHDFGAVRLEDIVRAALGRAAHDTVDVPRLAGRIRNGDGDFLADELFEVDLRDPVGHELDVEPERRGDRLGADERRQEQRVLA